MTNPFITNTRDLVDYLRSPDDTPKSRPVQGFSGLSVMKEKARWHFAFEHAGRRYHGSLGTYPTVSLKEAKALYIRKRFSITEGSSPQRDLIQPQDELRKARTTINKRTKRNSAQSPCFNDIKRDYFSYRLQKLRVEGTNKLPGKAIARMENLFSRFAVPIIGSVQVNQISNSHIIAILASIEGNASRTKAKAMLSILLQWLIQKGMIDPDATNINWDIINRSLPRINKISTHYPRLPFADAPRFFAYALKRRNNFRDNLLGLALALVALTAQRAGQFLCPDPLPTPDALTRFCHWRDIDLEAGIWTVPAEAMKVSHINGRALPAFRMPISKEAAWCLKQIKNLWLEIGIHLKDDDYIVPQYDDPRYPQKASSLRYFIEKTMHAEAVQESGLGFTDPDQSSKVVTVHGLRSTFADWAANAGYAENLIEKTLAHTMPRVQRAYQRDDLLEARREMMQAWGTYCFSMVPFKI